MFLLAPLNLVNSMTDGYFITGFAATNRIYYVSGFEFGIEGAAPAHWSAPPFKEGALLQK